MLVAQSCPILCNLMDYSPAGSSVHGISHARILEWTATFFSRESCPGDRTRVSCTGRRILDHWATREAHINKILVHKCSQQHYSREVKTTQISINVRVNKWNVVYQYNEMLLGHKENEVLTHATTWVNQENMLSERRQKGHLMYDFLYMKCPE